MKNREKIMATLVLLGSILMHSSSDVRLMIIIGQFQMLIIVIRKMKISNLKILK